MKNYSRYFLLAIVLFIFSCQEEESFSLDESFFKILDDTNADVSYHPIDVVQLAESYIILSGTELENTDFDGVKLIQTDAAGSFINELELTDYTVPVGDLFLNETDSITYFFAMNPSTLGVVLLGVDTNLRLVTETTIAGLEYPLAASISQDRQSLLLLSYDPRDQRSEISRISFDGTITNTQSYSIGPGDDIEEDIINHYLGASNISFPFFCGETSSGLVYFNGFYNFTFSLVFSDFGGEPTGIVQGQSTNAGTRYLLPLTDGTFAYAGYQFDESFQLAKVDLAENALSASVDLFKRSNTDLRAYTNTRIINYSGSSETLIFGAETKSRQIVLNFYENSDTSLQTSTHKIGFGNPFEFASMKQTNDGGIIILGTTFVAGRFERIVLIKYASQEVAAISR